MKGRNEHSFIVLVYKESPYLAECIESLVNQTVGSTIVLATSTPTNFVADLSRKYGLELSINPQAKGIAADWNYAYSLAETPYLTLAHQDDVYYPGYTEAALEAAGRFPKNLITFTDYEEIRDSLRVRGGIVKLKKVILFPFFVFRPNLRGSFLKRMLLSVGSPIPCPSVMYHKARIGEDFSFSEAFSINMDWAAWLGFARREGDFLYVKRTLMAHRIHAASATTKGIEDMKRADEDVRMFRQIWGKAMGGILASLYSMSYKSNEQVTRK